VAVLIPFHTPENWFWKEPLTGIYEACNELNHFRIEVREFLYDQFDKGEFIHRSDDIIKFMPDAVIAAPVYHQETRDFFDRCRERGIPFISLNDDINHPDQVACVGQDSERSGAVAAHLIRTGIRGEGRVLVVSIAAEKDNYNHILKREQGFRHYWSGLNGDAGMEIISRSISRDAYTHIRRNLGTVFEEHGSILAIFVTNSRVYQVARFLENTGKQDIMLVGYDLVKANIKYLNSGTIDFLISQKPREQGYKALISLFNTIKLHKKPIREQLIPIDIICKENLCCYQV
jgi:LacI family transcriptional regulator